MSSQELFSCDFPVYTVHSLAEGEFYIAGGGGEARTGVPNTLEVRHLSHNGIEYVTEVCHRHDSGSQVVMNSAVHPQEPDVIVAGMGGSCCLMSLTGDAEDEGQGKEEESEGKETVGEGEEADREEEKEEEEEGEGETEGAIEDVRKQGSPRSRKRNFQVKVLKSVQADFSESDPYLKAVGFSHDGGLVVTGGEDGTVRAWKYPGLEEVQTFSTEEKKSEIEGIACHPTKPQLLAVTRSGQAVVWNIKTAEIQRKFSWPTSRSEKPTYRFRACCFPPSSDPVQLISINVPLPRSNRPSYLMKWNADTWTPIKVRSTGREPLSALTVDPSGAYIGVGAGQGVSIYNMELQPLTQIRDVHGIFVTGLAFVILPRAADKPVSPGGREQVALVSVSADRLCCVTSIGEEKGVMSSKLLVLVLSLLVVILAMMIHSLWT